MVFYKCNGNIVKNTSTIDKNFQPSGLCFFGLPFQNFYKDTKIIII